MGRRITTGPVLPVEPGTLFDLASLTKPLCTALVALRLASRGTLDLETPVRDLLPEAGRGAAGRATVLDLLAHRSGLRAWLPLYLRCSTLPEAIAAIARTRPAAPARTKVIYSDLGYIILGAALERMAATPLPELFRREVAEPLSLPALRFYPPASWRRRTAATELGNRHERGMVGRRGAAYRGFRERLIWGEVHDHNAFVLGGACGHAGLFGDAVSVVAVGRAILGEPSGYLSEPVRRLLFADLTRGTGGHRSAGLQLASDPGSSAGRALSRGAAGHTGFTGTSLWVDPLREAVLVLLTNRMHPARSACDMHAVRRAFHDAVLPRRRPSAARRK